MIKLRPTKRRKRGLDARFLLEGRLSKKDADLESALVLYDQREYACLVPYVLEREKSHMNVIFDVRSLVELPEFLKMSLGEDQFVALVESLIAAFDEVDRLGVRYDCLLLDPSCVYVNAVRGSLSFLMCGAGKTDAPLAYDLFYAVGADAHAASYDVTRLIATYVEGVERAKPQGLAGYRLFAESFASRYRGIVPQVGTAQLSTSQSFSNEAFYDPKTVTSSGRSDAWGTSMLSEVMTDDPMLRLSRTSTGQSWAVARFPCVMGSSADADCRIDDCDWISRRHVRLTCEQGAMYLEDLNSTNGTSLNGIALVPGDRVRVVSGDRVVLAKEEFVVHTATAR